MALLLPLAALAALGRAEEAPEAPPPKPNLATTHLLTDAVESKGARCLDGSPQRYWLQQAPAGSPNATKWSVHHMGGGWCEDLDSCAKRAFGPDCYIGSSNTSCFATAGARTPGTTPPFAETMDFRNIPSCNGARWCGGLMMNDPAKNPLSHDWNKVLIPYCDGGSFGGNNESAVAALAPGSVHRAAGPVSLYFRGFRNLNAVIDDLVESHGLGQATAVLLSGDSAGGLATYWHSVRAQPDPLFSGSDVSPQQTQTASLGGQDHYAARLPHAKVLSAPDSGFFFDDPDYPAWRSNLGWVVAAMNSSAGLNQRCVEAQRAAGKDPMECRYPEMAVRHTATPTFVMNSK